MSKHTPGPWQLVEHSWSDTGIYSAAHSIALLSISHVATEENQSALEASMAANAKLIAAAPEMFAILDELEGAFDKEIYPEQKKEDFDALDDREYTVTITAKQWRALGRALGKAQGAT